MSDTVVINHTGYPMPPEMHEWPGVHLVECPREGPVPSDIEGPVVFTRTNGGPNLAELLTRGVEWVHTFGTGVDEFPFDAIDGQTLTCARGIGGEMIGEWVFAQMLDAAKGLREATVDRPPEHWGLAETPIGTLRGATVVIVGMGGIGTEVARLALALDMQVIGVRRSGTDSPHLGMTVVNDLAAVVGTADHVVLAVPATAETRGLLDADLFARMKPGTHLCNVARGTLVDQDALRHALDSGVVSRASLDVCDPEPLPEAHWLYTHPRVALTPHVSWSGPGAYERMIATFRANYDRWRAGEPLAGRVDLDAGY